MVVNRKPSGRTMSMGAGLALAGGVSMLMTLMMSAIIAFLADREILREHQTGYAVMALLLISAAAAAAVAIHKIRRRKLLVAGASGLIYFACLLGITALFFGGQYQGLGVTGLMILCGSALPLLRGEKGRGGVKKKHYKMPSR